MNTITIIVLAIIYIASGIAQYKSVKISHSKGGEWETISPTGADFIAVFIPIMNTVWAVLNWLSIWCNRSNSKKPFINRFFKIK